MHKVGLLSRSDATGLTEDSDAFIGQLRSSVFLAATTDVAAEDV
jgi:hypothetical protein